MIRKREESTQRSIKQLCHQLFIVGRYGCRPKFNDDVMNPAFLHFAYGMWKEKLETPSRLGNASTNTFSTKIAIRHKLLSNDTTPYYAEYMEPPQYRSWILRGGRLFSLHAQSIFHARL